MKAKLFFSMNIALIVILIAFPTYPAQAATKTTTENEVINSTTIWGDLDALGNTIYTQLDINVGVMWGTEVGTQLGFYRTVIDPEGNFVYTDDSFFGTFFTTESIFSTDPKFKEAALETVTFEGTPHPYTIQVNWTALGDLASRYSSFKQASHRPLDHYQVKFEGDTVSREMVATGFMNGQAFESPSLYAFFQRYTTLKVLKNLGGILLSLTDYFAPTIELGNKLMRGGEGYVAEATWIVPNPDGTTSEISLSVFDGFEQQLRLKYFFDGTDIYLSKITRDSDGNYISYEDGGVFINDVEKVLNVANNLDRASLPSTEIAICPWYERDENGDCINGEEMLIQADWSGVAKLVKSDRFRFTETTNCDDADCWFTEYEHNFKVNVIGSGESRETTAWANLNGVDLGPSIIDTYGQSAYLFHIKEYTIQYGGPYPFNVLPIQVP